MKVTAVYGSGVGTHPCAGAGWKIRPETHMEQKVLKEAFCVYEDLNIHTMRYDFYSSISKEFPDALTIKRTDGGEHNGDGKYEYFIHACSTKNIVNPHCASAPEGALKVARAFLKACATLCAKAKFTEAPSVFTQA